ncbi:hypothetical protein HID58_048191 [Brassica napus]|uniref:Uncharacterized protein n=1 Tax=Brassica napus TaxID=3708 RepID=A0ABQ8B1M0_BRANA|nr:hypothetical protein HID58_048191 [Brassica napus]
MSMPIESMLLAVNLNFLVFFISSDDTSQVFSSLVTTVAGTIAVGFINSIQVYLNANKRSLRNVSILKKKCYETNIIFIMPQRKCHLNNLENRSRDCYYYTQMEKFLELVLR